MPSSHRIHLIDASPYIFRGYYSLPTSITDKAGSPANAVFGFTDFLLKYVQEERPTHVGVAFDESLTTSFRNEIYPPYKAQRELPPAELEAQLKSCAEVARALGCATYVDERFEADDLIGTLCHQLTRKGQRVCVVSPDKDLAQLVGSKVTLFDYARGVRYTSRGVLEKFGVRPAQIADLLGLAGDSVDNIPGVRGVGPKTAVALLLAYKSLDRLYESLETVCELDLRGARTLGAKLESEREMAFLSRQLARIALDAPVRARLEELRFRGARSELVDPLFERLGFGRKRERIGSWA